MDRGRTVAPVAGFLAAALLALIVTAPPRTNAGRPVASTAAAVTTYTNPVFTDGGREMPDPAVIRGRDGYWYAYATGDNFRIQRSRDLVHWERVGSVFTAATRPSWAPTGGLWAPDIAYFAGRYHLTFTVANSPLVGPTPNRAVGVATAPTPTGPWTDSGRPLLEPQWWHPTPHAPRQFRSIMDTDLVATPDGRRILYYGGFKGGIHAVELTADGMSVAGEPVKVTSELAYEGPYVVNRDGWYYLFGSTGRCCLGPVSGYTVLVGRSRDPFGPFRDRTGAPMLGRAPGGTPVVAPTGNTWIGTGHHSIATDVTGQEWLVYHAIDRDDPSNTANPFTGNKRPMLVDRLDWIDGWPTVRGGAGASDTAEAAPAADPTVADAFESGDLPGPQWTDTTSWRIVREEAGGFARADRHDAERALTATRTVSGQVRARAVARLPEAGPRGASGLVFGNRGNGSVRVTVDRAQAALVVEIRRGGAAPARVTRPLPAGFRYDSWHEIAVEIRGVTLRAAVSDAGLHDPVATAVVRVPVGLHAGGFGVVASDATVDVDDVSVAPLYEPHTAVVPEPATGDVDPSFSDEFDGDALDPAWQWVRTPAASVRGGRLEFPVQPGDLAGADNDAPLLLRAAPDGEWTVETKVTVQFGAAQPDKFPQAGLVVYLDDDNFLRFTHRAYGAVRTTEYGKEMVVDGLRGYGSVDIVAPPAETTWLRLYHRIDPASGDHVYQAAASTDGRHWVRGAAYTLPAGTTPRVGLTSHGDDIPYGAAFDYLRFLRPGV